MRYYLIIVVMEPRSLLQGVPSYELAHEPPDIYLDDHIFDIKFAPTANALALGQITGDVRLFVYTEEENREALCLKYHTDSVRRLDFSPDSNSNGSPFIRFSPLHCFIRLEHWSCK